MQTQISTGPEIVEANVTNILIFTASHGAMQPSLRVTSRSIFGVIHPQDFLPIFATADFDKRSAHRLIVGMKGRVFDAELPHQGAAALLTVKRFGQTIMLAYHLPLRPKSGWVR